MEEKTTIQVGKKTLERLKSFKIAKRESYEEIINRMLNKLKGGNDDGRTNI